MDNYPKWFDRNMYIPSSSNEYWKLMITKRIHLRDIVEGKIKRKYTQTIGLSLFNNLIKITAKQSHPNLSPEQALLRKFFSIPNLGAAFILRQQDIEHLVCWSKRSSKFKTVSNTIRELNECMESSYRLKLKEAGEELKTKSEIWQESEQLKETEITEFNGWRNNFETNGHTPLMINLSKPVDAIMRDITLIKKKHDTQGRLLKDLEKEFRTWHKFGLLAYFDLKLWSKITGNRLPNNEIFNLIWPPEQQGIVSEEIFKKTTSRYMRKVFSTSTLNRL